MAIGRRPEARQHDMFAVASEIRAGGNPFYRASDDCSTRTDSIILRKRRVGSSMRATGVAPL